MACLFCDQTPETANAVERLEAIANLIGVPPDSVFFELENLLSQRMHAYETVKNLDHHVVQLHDRVKELEYEIVRVHSQYQGQDHFQIGPSPRLNRNSNRYF